MILEEVYEKARSAGIGHIFEFGEFPDAGEDFYFLDLMANRNPVEARAQVQHNVSALRKLTDEIEVIDGNRIVFRYQSYD